MTVIARDLGLLFHVYYVNQLAFECKCAKLFKNLLEHLGFNIFLICLEYNYIA